MALKSDEEAGEHMTNGSRAMDSIRFVVNYITRFLYGVIFTFCCWIPFQYLDGWFSWHVILCTFGYIPLMAEAIMMFVGDDIWSKNLSRKEKYQIHGYVITFSTVVVTVGNALVFHYISPGYHLYTVHGITGLISMIFLFLSIFVGLAVMYPDQVNMFLPLRLVWYKFLHNLAGLLAYLIGVVSLCSAYYTAWFAYYYPEEYRLAFVILTAIVSLWPLNGAVVSLYDQAKSALS